MGEGKGAKVERCEGEGSTNVVRPYDEATTSHGSDPACGGAVLGRAERPRSAVDRRESRES